MDKLDLLLEGIRNDGQKERDHIINNANKRSEEIKKEFREKSEKESLAIIENAKKEAIRIKENSSVTTLRQARDVKIEAKNELINDILNKLLQRLKKLGPNEYKKFVDNRLKEIDIEDGEILLQKDMKLHFKDSDFKNLKISKETVAEGFLVKSGKISYDNRYSSILSYDKDRLEKIIADRIFK